MSTNDTLSWYETSLPPRERKVRGHFSTPPALVEQILDACGYIPERDLLALRVLDPACGSGNFLAAAARRAVVSSQRQSLPPAKIRAAVQRNLWGFDPDPVACFLTEMRLREELAALPSLRRERSAYGRLHIHQADGLALPWGQHECVDLFLANPPYLAAKNNDLSGYRLAQHRGQADSYLLFLDIALRVVRPGGWIGLVLPDPVLARTNAMEERKRLLTELTLHHLWHLAGVFPAQVGAVVIIAQRRAPEREHYVMYLRGKWRHEVGLAAMDMHASEIHSTPVAQRISQRTLHEQPRGELRYLLGSHEIDLHTRLHALMNDPTVETNRHLVPLSQLVSIRRGEELGKKTALLTHVSSDDQTLYPVLRGGVDVRGYAAPRASYWIARDAIVKPLERYLAPKLLVVKSTAHLQASLDTRGQIALQTLYLLNPPPGQEEAMTQLDSLYFLLALLNSRLLREYVYVLHTAYKWVQPQLEQHVLARLPVPLIGFEQRRAIIARARALVFACSEDAPDVELKEQTKRVYEEQELAIRALYEYALAACSSLPRRALAENAQGVVAYG